MVYGSCRCSASASDLVHGSRGRHDKEKANLAWRLKKLRVGAFFVTFGENDYLLQITERDRTTTISSLYLSFRSTFAPKAHPGFSCCQRALWLNTRSINPVRITAHPIGCKPEKDQAAQEG